MLLSMPMVLLLCGKKVDEMYGPITLLQGPGANLVAPHQLRQVSRAPADKYHSPQKSTIAVQCLSSC